MNAVNYEEIHILREIKDSVPMHNERTGLKPHHLIHSLLAS